MRGHSWLRQVSWRLKGGSTICYCEARLGEPRFCGGSLPVPKLPIARHGTHRCRPTAHIPGLFVAAIPAEQFRHVLVASSRCHL